VSRSSQDRSSLRCRPEEDLDVAGGELRQRYREGQEDQLSALGLVLNVMVLWSTRYIDAALSAIKQEGLEVHEADVARLSPLGFDHINERGRYQFLVQNPIRRGELRPLRTPGDPEDAWGNEHA
jgi:hypothetical protein